LTTTPENTWKTVDEIADAVLSCTNCRLHENRTNAVPGDGSPVASILIIGEGPGFNEDQQGLPFVGRSGKLLDELLAQVPLSRKDVFITNVVKCRPPDNRDPLPDEVAACKPYLQRQLDLINPKVIVTLGRHSLLRYYPEGRISKDHGRIIKLDDRVLFPLYHPAAGLRNPAIKRDLQEDVMRLPEAIREALTMGVSQQPEADSDSNSEVTESQASQISEPIIENTQSEKEEGDQQLGLF